MNSAVSLHSRRTAAARPVRSVAARAGFSIGPFTFGGPKGPSKAEQRDLAKEELFELLAPLNRGASASEEDKAAVDALASKLEALNPTPNTLSSPLVNGSWELRYTTSASILGLNKPQIFRPSGKIFQILDAENLKARNVETAPFYNQVSANLEPLSSSKVAVFFQEFRIFNLIAVKAPPSAKGELDITYLDEDLRISRGDKGNLFVLTMDDRDRRP